MIVATPVWVLVLLGLTIVALIVILCAVGWHLQRQRTAWSEPPKPAPTREGTIPVIAPEERPAAPAPAGEAAAPAFPPAPPLVASSVTKPPATPSATKPPASPSVTKPPV